MAGQLSMALSIAEKNRLSRSIVPESEEPIHKLVCPKDWSVFSIVSPVLVAANGVSYVVAKVQNKLDTERFVRGKFYDLTHLTASTLKSREEHLLRHSKLCAKLIREPRLPIHFDVRRLAEDSGWWVFDEWIEGDPLSNLMVTMPSMDQSTVKVIGSETLLALGTLHSHRIVVRELAPERVIVTHDMTRCVVTDFEMAKLLDSNITVRGKWKLQTPYRAPEISRNSPEPQSDLFSWGVIMSELLTGDFNADEKALSTVVKDNLIVKLLLDCRKVVADDRPESSSDVLKIWNDWKI
jgi:serine/threonine protein kinase